MLSPEEAGDAGSCPLSQPTLLDDVEGAMGREVPMGPELGGGSYTGRISESRDGPPLLSSVLRSSCFLEETPRILAATVVAGLEAEGPGPELSILKQ